MRSKMLILFMLVLPAIVVTQARADLVAYWPFDEGTGTVAADVIGGNDGQITGCTWLMPGKVGDAAIEGVGGDMVDCGNGPTPTTEDLTLAWWMIDNHESYGRIMYKAVPDGDLGYSILVRSSSEDSPLRFRIGDEGDYGGWGEECRLPAGAYNDGEWVHITCTYDSATDTATIYVNGELAPYGDYNPKTGISSYCDGVNVPDVPLYIRGGVETFDGVMDEVAIWDNALTADEVQEVYEFGPQPAGAKNPNPENHSTVGIANPLTLSWTNMDPNYPGDDVYVDVYWGTEPNALHPAYDLDVPIIAGESIDSTDVDSSAVDTYYWRVDSYIYGADNINEPNRIEGVLWMYTTSSDAAPTVVIETLDQMTWSGEGVPLDSTVTDDGASALTIEWSADLPIGFTASFDPGNDVEDPTVTLNKVPYIEDVIVNAGFEAWILGDDGWGETPGWSAVGTTDSGSWNPPATAYASIPEGNNVAWVGFNAEMDPTGAGGGLAQVLAETFASDTIYELKVDVGKSPIVDYAWPGYKVQLLAGGTVLEEDDNTLSIDIGTFATSTVTYTYHPADSGLVGQPLEIRLLAKVPVGTGWNELNFDDVRLTADPPFDPTWVTPTGVQTVTVTVAVGDVANPASDTASIEIDVYDDACHMARIGEGKTQVTDFNGNCITDLEDLAVVAATWLDDYSSTGPADL